MTTLIRFQSLFLHQVGSPSFPLSTLDPLIQPFSSYWKLLQGTSITQALLVWLYSLSLLCPSPQGLYLFFPPLQFGLPSSGFFFSTSVLFTPMTFSSSDSFSGPIHSFSCWLCPLDICFCSSLYFPPMCTLPSHLQSVGWSVCLH